MCSRNLSAVFIIMVIEGILAFNFVHFEQSQYILFSCGVSLHNT